MIMVNMKEMSSFTHGTRTNNLYSMAQHGVLDIITFF